MLRRKPTRVEDRADVAEEYELYLAAKEAQEQQRPASMEDVDMQSAVADNPPQQERQQQERQQQQRAATRSRIGISRAAT